MATNVLQRQDAQTSEKVERTRSRRVFVPPVDIFETPESVVLVADMPGVAEKDVSITLENDLLTIEGNLEDPSYPGQALTYQEYENGDYRRVFTLSTDVERDKIAATVKDGVLRLELPKAEPVKARKIEVRAG